MDTTTRTGRPLHQRMTEYMRIRMRMRNIVQLEDRRAMDQTVDGGYRRAGVGE